MQSPSGSPQDPSAIDWQAIEASPEFQELVTRKRRFVLPATIFFLAWYLGFILLAGYAPDFMGESIYQGFTVGYALALTQFVMVWGLGAWYLRKADREFDPLERQAVQHLEATSERTRTDGRFKPSTTPAAPTRTTTGVRR
jgi:uncharacterized membrane protein (DUF485 family)